jgi:arabinofuranan 3-O-arabinosyltransferase
MAAEPLVSVIVPTRNSAVPLADLLESLRASTYRRFELVVNDALDSADDLPALLAGYAGVFPVRYLRENTSMAQGRHRGAQAAQGEILLHLDSDMTVAPGLLAEVVARLTTKRCDALVIPEESYGTTFWARCKWLEKKCIEGVEEIESLRALRRAVYDAVGGYDVRMVFSEDKDLDLRVRKAGFRVGRTTARIFHNEGDLSLRRSVGKKVSYAATADLFAQKHPAEFRWQRNIWNRYAIYARHWRYLMRYPTYYIGMCVLKTGEFAFGGVAFLRRRSSSL